jgi:hypothetical protein
MGVRKKYFSYLRFFYPIFCIGLFLVGCSGSMAPLGGNISNNAAAPGMATGVSAPGVDQNGPVTACLLFDAEYLKNEDANSKHPYHIHLKGTLGCSSSGTNKICYGGRVFRAVEDGKELFDIQTIASASGDSTAFDIQFDSDRSELNYLFYMTPKDYTAAQTSLTPCPEEGCFDPSWPVILKCPKASPEPFQIHRYPTVVIPADQNAVIPTNPTDLNPEPNSNSQ